MESTNTQTKRRGRPSLNIEWPENDFTVKDVQTELDSRSVKLSHVSIQLKINRAVEQGSIQRVGTVKQKWVAQLLFIAELRLSHNY